MHYVQLAQEKIPIGKIVCIGRNYVEHIRELGNQIPDQPVIFIKPASSVIPDGGTVIIPPYSTDCHHEVELAVLIGKKAKDIAPGRALDCVAGYGVALDLTLRDIQGIQKQKGLPWEIAKAFDTACPLSEFIPAEQVNDPQNLGITLSVNGTLRQDGNTGQMMRSIKDLIASASSYFTLEEGDILLTGTPSGVGKITSGDSVEARIEQVGRLSITVA